MATQEYVTAPVDTVVTRYARSGEEAANDWLKIDTPLYPQVSLRNDGNQ
jgi:hypothetical protein